MRATRLGLVFKVVAIVTRSISYYGAASFGFEVGRFSQGGDTLPPLLTAILAGVVAHYSGRAGLEQEKAVAGGQDEQ